MYQPNTCHILDLTIVSADYVAYCGFNVCIIRLPGRVWIYRLYRPTTNDLRWRLSLSVCIIRLRGVYLDLSIVSTDYRRFEWGFPTTSISEDYDRYLFDLTIVSAGYNLYLFDLPIVSADYVSYLGDLTIVSAGRKRYLLDLDVGLADGERCSFYLEIVSAADKILCDLPIVSPDY